MTKKEIKKMFKNLLIGTLTNIAFGIVIALGAMVIYYTVNEAIGIGILACGVSALTLRFNGIVEDFKKRWDKLEED